MPFLYLFISLFVGVILGMFIQCLRFPKSAGRLIFTKIEGKDIVLAEFNKDPGNYEDEKQVIMKITHDKQGL